MNKASISLTISISWLVLHCSVAPPGSEPTFIQTTWLKECTSDSECAKPLTCECGVCTRQCADGAACVDLDPTAICGPKSDCSQGENVCLEGPAGTGGATNTGGSGSTSTSGSASSGGREAGGSGTGAGTSLAGSTAGGEGGAPLESSGGASDPGGPELGAVCYDNDVSETVLTCAEGYCDRALNCTDREPPHCTRVCACHAKGDACRQVNADGSVPLDEPCCDDMVCMKNGLASSGGTEVYTCELPGTLACNVDCQVRLAETPCGSDPSANVMWTCRTAPPEVLEHCMDRGTQIPSWCCPSTVLPECISQ
jgi:hypothetical protein